MPEPVGLGVILLDFPLLFECSEVNKDIATNGSPRSRYAGGQKQACKLSIDSTWLDKVMSHRRLYNLAWHLQHLVGIGVSSRGALQHN